MRQALRSAACAALRFSAAVLALFALLAAAQQDAGADSERASAHPEQRSRFFPKLVTNPSLLSDRVRARLAESGGEWKGGSLAAAPEDTIVRADDVDDAAAVATEARVGRMFSFETSEGVTVLSNRPQEAPPPARASAEPVVEESPVPLQKVEPGPAMERSEPHESRSAAGAEPPRVVDGGPSRWPWLLLIGSGAAAFGAWFALRGRRAA